VNERNPHSGSTFQTIRAIDYTVIFARDMVAMRRFYEDILGFPLLRELSPGWIEYQVGHNTLALARPRLTAADVPTPNGSASLQLAFKVSAPDVDRCADELVRQRVARIDGRVSRRQPLNARQHPGTASQLARLGHNIEQDQADRDRRTFGGDFAGSPL
jgi:catechol 2,3-dioxygenase-like lactoylglutathione lyase family enzyme